MAPYTLDTRLNDISRQLQAYHLTGYIVQSGGLKNPVTDVVLARVSLP